MKLFYKVKYFFGTIYRGLIGVWHNTFDKLPAINSEIESFVIGKSTEDRNIKCYKIGEGDNKLLMIGGIHGNETGTVKLAHHILNWFYNSSLKTGVTLYVIPCLNVDGYAKAVRNPDYMHRGKVGRFNANGVDLNRNFPTKNFEKYSEWRTGKNYADSTKQIFCGEFGGSEPETKALIQFIKEKNIQNVITLHNVGKDVVLNKGDQEAKRWAGIYKKNGFKIRYDLKYPGCIDIWCNENNIHFLSVEGSSRWGSDWGRQKNAVVSVVKSIAN